MSEESSFYKLVRSYLTISVPWTAVIGSNSVDRHIKA